MYGSTFLSSDPRFPKEHNILGGSQVLPVCFLIRVLCGWNRVWSIDGMILTRENPKYSERKLFQCHLVRHKSHIDFPEIEPGCLQ